MDQKLNYLVEQYNKVMQLYGENKINETNEQVKIMLKLASEINNHYYYAVGLNFLGALQTAMSNENRALDFYFEAMIYGEKYQVIEFLPVIYNNIGARYMDASVYDEALVYLKKAEEILEVQEENEHVSELVNNSRKVINYMNMALSYTYINEYRNSNRYLEKAKPLIDDSKLNLDFTYNLLRCQNYYYLGNIEYVNDHLEQLMVGIRQLDSLYNYQNNIADMFRFLSELDDKDKLKELLDIVDRFVSEHSDASFELMLCEIRVDYEKRYGSDDDYKNSCVALANLYHDNKIKSIEQRRDYMALRLAMREGEAKRNEEEKRQQRLLSDALENAKKANIAKSQFLSGMSHELRTPLNAVIGYLSIAKDSNDDLDKITHCIEKGDIAAKQLLQIINNVLDMSSIESGRMKIANDEFDLKKEISDITTIFYQTSKSKDIRFVAQIDKLMQEWVIGDQLRLKQVLLNLLSNAMKFTDRQGMVKLVVRQLAADDNSKDCYIQFIVSDTGIGMSKEYMERIFNPFEQEHASTARKYGGSGLGLSITHNLINMMGGTIEVKSVLDQGTTFIITMPFEKSLKHSNHIYKNIGFTSLRTLIINDLKDEALYIKAMLKACNIKSDIVTTNKDALKRIKSRLGGDYSYDICLFDWNNKDNERLDIIKEIRKICSDKRPIIIASAYDETEVESEALKAGVNKIILKPIFQSTLFDLLVDSFGGYNPIGKKNEENNNIDMSGIKVLLVEDNEMNMDIAMTILKKAGIVVDTAQNGQIAVDKFLNSKAYTYDMILMDVQMPIMDGYQATSLIRNSKHIEAKSIPIIAMTANAFVEDINEALSKGMNAHIAKPINYDKMFDLLKKYKRKKPV